MCELLALPPHNSSSLLVSFREWPLPGVQEAQAALPVAVLQGGELGVTPTAHPLPLPNTRRGIGVPAH